MVGIAFFSNPLLVSKAELRVHYCRHCLCFQEKLQTFEIMDESFMCFFSIVHAKTRSAREASLTRSIVLIIKSFEKVRTMYFEKKSIQGGTSLASSTNEHSWRCTFAVRCRIQLAVFVTLILSNCP